MSLEALFEGPLIGIGHVPADYVAPRQGIAHVWRRHVVANAYVRSGEYMAQRFRARFGPQPLVHCVGGSLPIAELEAARTLILLYPDPIGLDFGRIERSLVERWPGKPLLALTGRGRLLRLDGRTRRQLRSRRALARARLPEFLFVFTLLLLAPVLLFADLVRGHR